MRYLAIDYGEKRVGLALCDPSETIVSPLCQVTMPAAGWQRLAQEIGRHAKEHEVEALVVGLPINMDGSEGEQALRVRRFAAVLQKLLDLPIHLHDERLSSQAADELIAEVAMTSRQRKQRRDMLAAYQVLKSFLQAKRA
jgi:putative Holliday junction resolvase